MSKPKIPKNKNRNKTDIYNIDVNKKPDIKLPSNHQSNHSGKTINKKKQKILVTVLIILTLVTILGIYYWLVTVTTNHNMNTRVHSDNISLLDNTNVSPNPEINAVISNTQTTSPSDEISAIVSDLESTSNLNDIEKDINKIDVIINED